MVISNRFSAALLVLSMLIPMISQSQTTGPTAYPDPNNEAAWPGKGPIRSAGYMMDNRRAFWTTRETDQGSTIFIGDSLVGGYPVAAAFPKFKVANHGVGGEVTRGLLFRLKEDVIDWNPQAVVICSGSNDLSCRSDPALAVENLGLAVDQLRKADPKLPIILCLVTPRDVANAPITEGSLQQLNDGIKKLAEGKENIVVVDVFAPLAAADGKPIPEYFHDDKIHPTPAGYEKWTALLTPVFEKFGLK